MTPSPKIRARHAADREITALAMHTPSIERIDHNADGVFTLHVDLPYLAKIEGASGPQRVDGFALGVRLPERYPVVAPEVFFLGSEIIFHPAIMPGLGVFCIGNGVWTPDIGLAQFVRLHLQSVVGLIEIDTLDAFFGEPVCTEAAAHYHGLREAGGLPLACPVFSSGPATSPEPAGDRRRVPGAMPGVGAALTVRGPRGRRVVSLAPGSGAGVEAMCWLSEKGWWPTRSEVSARALAWLRDRIDRETCFTLSDVDGAAVLRTTIERAGDGRADREECPDPEARVRARFEPMLARCDLPVSALGEEELARHVVAALGERG